ncbi:hypothetical protein X777_16886 [Ooceraea biroi]|uniref:Uncharacterized protein n=1 Tax=Ooceraea biroi TaxID=2015173 RepID=A0A026WSC2_OOCBI|nr:hypothetical protein X777_16886 [Ooceraea biroi]
MQDETRRLSLNADTVNFADLVADVNETRSVGCAAVHYPRDHDLASDLTGFYGRPLMSRCKLVLSLLKRKREQCCTRQFRNDVKSGVHHRFSIPAFRRLTTIGSTPASPFEASLTMKETRDYLVTLLRTLSYSCWLLFTLGGR